MDNLAIKLYKSIHDDNKPRVFEHWHASSIGECPRAHYFKRLGIKPLTTPTASKMLRWQAGHIIEEVIRPHLLKLYPDLTSNVRLTSEKLDLTGEYDNYSEKEKTIFEIKSVSGFAFKKHNGTVHLRGLKPYLGHEYQNHAYVELLREIKKPVENIVYIYISLDGLIVAYPTKVNPNITKAIHKRLGILEEALKGVTPECLCDSEHPLWDSVMRWCDYQTPDGDCCDINLIKENKDGE